MVIICNVHSYIHWRSIGRYAATLVEECIDGCAVWNDNDVTIPDFQGEDRAVFRGPFPKPTINLAKMIWFGVDFLLVGEARGRNQMGRCQEVEWQEDLEASEDLVFRFGGPPHQPTKYTQYTNGDGVKHFQS